jgi:metallo-beta-lactamase family protein
VFLDSPMAVDASQIFCRNLQDHRLSEHECRTSCGVATYVLSTEESKELTANPVPKVIISASGMAAGGRVLHHLKRYAPDAKSTVLFAGFQAAGTRGAAMTFGASSIRIHGKDVPVRAEVHNLSMLSAHGDASEIVRWLSGFEHPPRTTFITHGETTAAEALKRRIEQELGWVCRIPKHLESEEL